MELQVRLLRTMCLYDAGVPCLAHHDGIPNRRAEIQASCLETVTRGATLPTHRYAKRLHLRVAIGQFRRGQVWPCRASNALWSRIRCHATNWLQCRNALPGVHQE